MDRKRTRFLYNRCDPNVVLKPGDDRYIDLDKREVRGIDWVARLAKRIELSNRPTCQLFTGLPGSGKSTELLRLAKRLEDVDNTNLLVVVIDAEKLLDTSTPIDVPDVLFAILDQTERALLEAEGKDPEEEMAKGYFKRLWGWLSQTDVALTEARFGISNVAIFTAELRTRADLRERVRSTVGAHFHRFLGEVRDELTKMEARAVALGREGLVVIFDSLEKLRGIASNWDTVLESAERIFGEGAPYLQLPIHVLYTIPPALVSRKRFAEVDFMPMIKLYQHPKDGGGRCSDGFDAAVELVRQRVPEQDLVALFGDKMGSRVEELIAWSGGYPREIIRLLQNAFLATNMPLEDADFRRLLDEVGDQYRKIVTADAFPWLAQVAVDRYLTNETEKQRLTADNMLANSVVLRYLNGSDWFDLHPAVKKIPGVAAEIEKRTQAAK